MPLSPSEAAEKALVSNKNLIEDICKDIDAQLEIRYDGKDEFKTMNMDMCASSAVLEEVKRAYIEVGWLGTEYRYQAHSTFYFILRKRVKEIVTGKG